MSRRPDIQPNAGTMQADDRSARIRALNDTLRQGFPSGEVVATRGVAALPMVQQAALYLSIQAYDAFTEDNDPHGEHDFGAVNFDGELYLWKIDYYDNDLEFGSPDPSDPDVTRRVMTIMRADEY